MATTSDSPDHDAPLVNEPVPQPPAGAPDRNLALELVRVTEAAALAAARWVGRGDKISADQAAVDAMRLMLDTVSIAVVAVAERGSMFFPGAAGYMDKIAAGPEVADAIDITAPPAENVKRVAKAKGVPPEEVSVVVLDRDRHQDLIRALRESGARVHLITDGDVAPSIAAAQERTGVDLLMGIGGTPEGVISAAALKCLGGGMQGKLWPRNDEERQTLIDQGFDLDRVLTTDDLVSGQDVFVAATGVTTGALLRGVRYHPGGATTESIVMRSRSGTVRRIEATHAFEKLMKFSNIEYR